MKQLALLAVLTFGFFPPAQAADAGEGAGDLNELILAELQPVVLQNCDLKRFGGANDAGYLLCDNLGEGIESVYSYEVHPIDNFACDISTRYEVPVHYYNCNVVPDSICEGGSLVYHEECVGEPALDDWPVFDTLQSQIEQNRDSDKQLIVEMDIEAAEWGVLKAAPDALLERIDQLAVEMHQPAADPQNLDLIRRLKQHFHLVNLHFSNNACSTTSGPLPATIFQALWVNKRLGEVDTSAPVPAPYSALNTPDRPDVPDCQLAPSGS